MNRAIFTQLESNPKRKLIQGVLFSDQSVLGGFFLSGKPLCSWTGGEGKTKEMEDLVMSVWTKGIHTVEYRGSGYFLEIMGN
jgi:hypothetical protein